MMDVNEADVAAIRKGIEDEAAGRLVPAREAVAELREKYQLAMPENPHVFQDRFSS